MRPNFHLSSILPMTLCILSAFPVSRAAEPITLQSNVQWQNLPPKVLGAVADPGGRIWYRVVERDPSSRTLPGLKDLLRAQFGEKNPQFPFLPVLFEPSGRVWVRVVAQTSENGSYGAVLLGYDGKDLVERAITQPEYPDAPSRPTTSGLDAASAGGTAFFVSGPSIYGYDGKTWDTRDVNPGPNGRSAYKLYPEPDGKGIVAASAGLPEIWRWRDGKWTTFVKGPGKTDQTAYDPRQIVTDFCPMDDGLWMLAGDRVIKLPWNNLDSAATGALIAQLKDESFEVREAATNALIRRGAAASDELHKVLLANQNNEMKYRIEFILRQLSGTAGYAPADARLKCGRYVVEQPVFFLTVSDGSLLIAAMSLTDDTGAAVTTRPATGALQDSRQDPWGNRSKRVAPGGVIRVTHDGQATLLGGEELIALITGSRNINRGNFGTGVCSMAPDKRSLWFETMGFGSNVCVDAQTGKAATYGGGSRQILAIASDGKVFLNGGRAVVVLDPTAQDSRTPVAPVAVIGQDRAMWGASSRDGTFWFTGDEGIRYFDGRQLQTAPSSMEIKKAWTFSPGNDCVLVQSGNRYYFVSKTTVFSDDLLQDLVAKNAPALAASFSRSMPGLANNNTPYLHGDAAGNVWVLANQQLRVFSNNAWIDGGDALTQAGGRGRVAHLLPLGDNSKMLIVEEGSAATAFLASCADGKLSLDRLETGIWETGISPVVEPDGALWVTVHPTQRPIPPQAWRLTEKGPTKKLSNVSPIAFDHNGNLWISLLEEIKNGETVLATYRDGTTTRAPKVSDTGYFAQLFPAASGEVYVATSLGLVELRPTAPGAATFTVGRTLNLKSAKLTGFTATYSMETGLLALPGAQETTGYATDIFKIGTETTKK